MVDVGLQRRRWSTQNSDGDGYELLPELAGEERRRVWRRRVGRFASLLRHARKRAAAARLVASPGHTCSLQCDFDGCAIWIWEAEASKHKADYDQARAEFQQDYGH